ncbi:MAG: hypothetical protein ACRC37_06635, partial [Lentisphaeria bacterium]
MDIRATNIDRVLNISFGNIVDDNFVEVERVYYQASYNNIFIAFRYELKNRGITHFKIYKEQGAGSFQFDNIKVYNFTPFLILESITNNRLTTNNKYCLYTIKVETKISYGLPINKLSFAIAGNCSKQLLRGMSFDIFISQANQIDSKARLITSGNIVNNKLDFNFPFILNDGEYILLRINLYNCAAQGADNGALLSISLSDSKEYDKEIAISNTFSINPPFILSDNFVSLYTNPWQSPNGSFIIIESASAVGAGRVYTNNEKLLCNTSVGNSIIYLASPVIYGRWNFFVADGQYWKVSARNNIRIILAADTYDHELLQELNFNGYYLIHDKTFKLYKANGIKKTLLADSFIPEGGDTESTNNGYEITVSHTLGGNWYVNINGKMVIPNNTFPNVVDDEIKESVSFGFNTHISSETESDELTGKRVAYLDNLHIEEFINRNMNTEDAINLKVLVKDENLEISWNEITNAVYELSYFCKVENSWNNYCITKETSLTTNSNLSTTWRLVVRSENNIVKTIISCIGGIKESIVINEGWNLIGDSGDDDFNEIIKAEFANNIWQWNGSYYELNDEIKPLTAFWVKSKESKLLTFTPNINYQNLPENLEKKGWHLLSFNDHNKFLAEETDLHYYNGADYETHNYLDISNYNGYWIFNE